MHEFSTCQTLLKIILQELDKVKNKPVRLKKARVLAGLYYGLMPASLKAAYKVLSKDTPAEGSTLLVKTVPLKLRCHQCGWQGATRAICFFCPKCGAGNLEITGGKELYLESIEVESA